MSIYDNNLQNTYLEGALKELQDQIDAFATAFDNYYSKSEIDTLLESCYTQTQIDELLDEKVDVDFSGLTEKTATVDDDLIIINDSEDSNTIKKVKKSNFASSGGGGAWESVFDSDLSFTGASSETLFDFSTIGTDAERSGKYIVNISYMQYNSISIGWDGGSGSSPTQTTANLSLSGTATVTANTALVIDKNDGATADYTCSTFEVTINAKTCHADIERYHRTMNTSDIWKHRMSSNSTAFSSLKVYATTNNIHVTIYKIG